jgi:hypothetical protein
MSSREPSRSLATFVLIYSWIDPLSSRIVGSSSHRSHSSKTVRSLALVPETSHRHCDGCPMNTALSRAYVYTDISSKPTAHSDDQTGPCPNDRILLILSAKSDPMPRKSRPDGSLSACPRWIFQWDLRGARSAGSRDYGGPTCYQGSR